jgi:hypothetical protein
VNDPYDGDWALNPLGGKQIKMQVDSRACRVIFPLLT